jgi:hypothetical protein
MVRSVVFGLFALACAHQLRPQAPVDVAGDLLAAARARATPAKVVGRFSVSLAIPGRDGVSTGGAVVLDRPGKGHVAVLGPLGGPLATLQTDGTGVAVAVSRGHQHFVAADADAVLRDATHGAVTLDDLFGLFVGDLPLDQAAVVGRRALGDGAEVVLEAPEGGTLTVDLARDATPRLLRAVDQDGKVELEATYLGFEPLAGTADLVPTELTLKLPALGVEAGVKMKSWTVPDTVPDVFGLAPPDGFTSEPLEDLLGHAGGLGDLLTP